MTSNTPKGAALITGASSGIGATYAERLARRGHDLVLVARDEARLRDLAARLRSEHGVTVSVLRADLTQGPDVKAVARRLTDDAAIALFVNNAGIAPATPLLASDPDTLDTVVALNVAAASRLAVAAAQAFAARGRGQIVNIASALAVAPELFNGVYSGTKAFVLALSQSLAVELAGKGVQVQAVLPGFTRTEIFDRAGADFSGVDPERIMEVGELVDAALAGLDRGELVTIPSLADPHLWEAADAARKALGPGLSNRHPAARYGVDA